MTAQPSPDPEVLRRATYTATHTAVFAATLNVTSVIDDELYAKIHGTITAAGSKAIDTRLYAAVSNVTHRITYDAVQSCLPKEKS